MKSIALVPFLACALLASAGIVLVTHNGLGPAPAVLAASSPAPDPDAAPNVAGNWQLSWIGRNDAQRQASLAIKQDGNKLSGKFEGEQGSAALSGNLEGAQVSFTVKTRRRTFSFTGAVEGDKMSGTTEQGAAWTASR